MAAPRLKVATERDLCQLPYSGQTVRDRLADARRQLDQADPDTLDTMEQLLDRLHALLCGRCETEEIRGDRTPRYRRGQLTGQYDLPTVDLVFLARHEPSVATAVASVFAALAEDGTGNPGTLADEGARLSRAAGRLLSDLMLALEDGTVSDREAAAIEECIDGLETTAANLRLALRARRRRIR